MQVVGNVTDFLDRFDIIVDPDAEPTDIDEALAEFLLNYVRTEAGANPGDT